MKPSASERNLTPSSTAVGSLAAVAVVAELQIVQGQFCEPEPTVRVTPALGISRLPLSSTDRLLIVADPELAGVQLYVHVPRPVARCHVVPLSTETSTPPTTPPP